MAKKGEMPELIFIAPIGGGRKTRYKHCVFQVLTQREDGLPLTCRLIQDDEVVNLVGGEYFITAYVPMVNFRAKKPPF